MRVGFIVDERLGDKGTFYYPKEGLVATAVINNDIQVLATADPEERERIFELRSFPVQKKMEIGPKERELEVDYNLLMSNL